MSESEKPFVPEPEQSEHQDNQEVIPSKDMGQFNDLRRRYDEIKAGIGSVMVQMQAVDDFYQELMQRMVPPQETEKRRLELTQKYMSDYKLFALLSDNLSQTLDSDQPERKREFYEMELDTPSGDFQRFLKDPSLYVLEAKRKLGKLIDRK
jgi:hypothetical protein